MDARLSKTVAFLCKHVAPTVNVRKAVKKWRSTKFFMTLKQLDHLVIVIVTETNQAGIGFQIAYWQKLNLLTFLFVSCDH